METLQELEKLPAVEFLKASFVAYPLVNALHIAAIGCVFTSILLIDLRILGVVRGFPATPFEPFFRGLAVLAFLVAAVSGAALFSVRASHYAGLPIFLAKMGLIAIALVNFAAYAVINRLHASEGALRVLALLSILLWTAVLVCGRFIGFF